MKKSASTLVLAGVLGMTAPSVALTAGTETEGAGVSTTWVKYRTPYPDAPVSRREGGLVDGSHSGVSRGITRGITRGVQQRGASDLNGDIEPAQEHMAADSLVLAPLAPRQVGYSADSAPEVYWYLSQAWPEKLVFKLNKDFETVLKLDLPPPTDEGWQAGMHAVDLSDHQVNLEADTEYEWFVLAIPDPEERAADILASATIRFQPAATELAASVKNAAPDARYRLYAEHGYWYDALAALNRLIEQKSGDPMLHLQRAAFSEQVEMPIVAKYDRELAEGSR